ncbi:MAG TPA: XRE family transcriptional regulator [Bacteroidetes bacterium]|nr:XRE family transcriptional regulator [Bacteroidota bacterium]
MNNIAYKIKKARINKGFSQEDIAAKLNVSQSAYAKIENGITKLDIERLLDIVIILEMDIQDLLNVEESKTVNYKNAKNSPAFVENFNIGIKEAYEITIKNLKDEIAFYRRLLENK